MRRSLIVAGTVIVVGASVVLAGELIAGLISLDRYRPIFEQKLSQAIGLTVEIRGDLHLSVFPLPRIEATEIVLADPARPTAAPLFDIRTGELTLDWRGLFFGAPRVRQLIAVDTELRIEREDESPPLSDHLERLEGDVAGEGIDLQIRRVRFENLNVFYRGSSETFRSAHFRLLSFDAEERTAPLDFLAQGDFEGGSFDVWGVLGPLPELLRPTQPYPIQLGGRVMDTQISVEGTVSSPMELRGIDLALSATLPSLAALAPEGALASPQTGAITISGRMTDPNGTPALEELEVTTAASAPLRLELSGSVMNLFAFRGVELDLQMDADDASFLEPFLEWEVPDVGPVRFSARIEDRDGSLGLEGELHAGRDEELAIDLTGRYDDLRETREIDISAKVWSRDLRTIGSALELDLPLPALGPFVASGRLRDLDGTLGIEGISVEIGSREETWAALSGSIRDLVAMQGIELSTEFGASDLRHASPYLRGEPPDIGPLSGVATLADLDGTLGVERFRIQGGRVGLFELDLSGSFDDVLEIDELEAEGKLTARDLTVVGSAFGVELPALGPLEFSGWVRGSAGRIVSEGQARIDQTRFSAEWSAVFAEQARPHVRAQLTSPHVYLDDIGLAPEYEPVLPAPRVPGATDSIPLELLRAFDADVLLHADRVTGRGGFDFRNVSAEIRLADGRLVLSDLLASSDGGRVRTNLEIDTRARPPELAFRTNVEEMDLTRLMSQLQEETDAAGLLFLSADLRSRGRTVSEIRSNMSGHLQSMMRDGVLASQWARRFVANFARLSFPSILIPDAAPVSCVRIELEIEGGVASVERLLLQSPNIIVTGQGEIDIGRNALDLRLTPKVRDPGLLSVAVSVNVSGPITDPVYSSVRRTIATSVAEGLIKNAMRPARALMRPLRRQPETADACAEPLRAVYTAPD